MACFLLRAADGSERWIEELVPYVRIPGEEIVPGAIMWDCGEQPTTTVDNTGQLIMELDYELGRRGMGEAIKYLAGPIAKMIGRQNCTSCEIRRVIANAFARLKARYGLTRAILKMVGLVVLSVRGKDEKVLRKLKAYLNA